jgi:hypothetical protein
MWIVPVAPAASIVEAPVTVTAPAADALARRTADAQMSKTMRRLRRSFSEVIKSAST